MLGSGLQTRHAIKGSSLYMSSSPFPDLYRPADPPHRSQCTSQPAELKLDCRTKLQMRMRNIV